MDASASAPDAGLKPTGARRVAGPARRGRDTRRRRSSRSGRGLLVPKFVSERNAMGHERRQPAARRLTPMPGLRKRADFLAAARGAKAPCVGFVLQARERDCDGPARVGFTVSRQVGTAVERNRVRRRLREVVRLTPPDRIRPGHDYVLIGRRAALELPFQQLKESFEAALRRIHAGSGGRAGQNRKLRGPSPADARTHR